MYNKPHASYFKGRTRFVCGMEATLTFTPFENRKPTRFSSGYLFGFNLELPSEAIPTAALIIQASEAKKQGFAWVSEKLVFLVKKYRRFLK